MIVSKGENIGSDRWLNELIQQYADKKWYVLHKNGSITAKTDFSIRVKVKARLIQK